MNIRLDAFICYTELVPDCALGEAFEYDRSTNILLLERVYAGGPGLDAAMLCFGNRLVGVNEASIPYNRNILSSFAAGSYALEYDHCGRQVAKYCCGMMDSEIAEFASVCRTASLTTAADEYDRGGYALSPVPTAWPGDVVWAKYYDDYRFVAVRGLGADFAFEATAAIPAYASATGLLTGMYTGSGYEAYYYDGEGREILRYATGYNRGRRCTAYNYDGTIASRTYSYKESYLPDMEEVYVYDSCGRLTSTTIRVDKAVSVPVLNPAAGQDAADSEATDTASPAASSRWATAVIRREYGWGCVVISFYGTPSFFSPAVPIIYQAAVFCEFFPKRRFVTKKKPDICKNRAKKGVFPPFFACFAIIDHIFARLKAMAKKAKSIVTLSLPK